MSEVYLAERADGLFRSRVAVKFLRWALNGHALRFDNERRILAGLTHSGIARLLDAGVDSVGAPYAVMELVDGEPIDRYCEHLRLTVRSRVQLFLRVIDAVQHAHESLVIHRDLKPANVLVTSTGEPKLLDFGIAKLLQETSSAGFHTTLPLMTPSFASPEQVLGHPIAVTSDIYSLGMMLYLLLVGRLPYQVVSTAPDAMVQMVCRTDPPLPSRLARDSGIRVDQALDHVLLKALAKSPAQRYRTCVEFADDLRRWLQGRPVRAMAASRGYRAYRFAARHRVALAFTAVVAGTLLAISVVALGQAREARHQAEAVVLERERLSEMNSFLEEAFQNPRPGLDGRLVTVAEMLDIAADRLDRRLGSQPLVAAAMRHALAISYEDLGAFDKAVAQREVGLSLLVGETTATAEQLATARLGLATLHYRRLNFDTAKSLLEAARRDYASRENLLSVSIESLTGSIAMAEGHMDLAEKHLSRALALGNLADPPLDAQDLAGVLNNLATLRSQRGDPTTAGHYRRRALELLMSSSESSTTVLLITQSNLAQDEERIGNLDEAERLMREVLQSRERVYGVGHAATIRSRSNLAGFLNRAGRSAEAEEVARRAWNEASANDTLTIERVGAAAVLGAALIELGQAEAALGILREALSISSGHYPSSHWMIPYLDLLLGHAWILAGERASGLARVRDAGARLAVIADAVPNFPGRVQARLERLEREYGDVLPP